mgnify:CR=1 FL=1
MIRIKDLRAWEKAKRIETPDGPVWIEAQHPSLYCGECQCTWSANPGDYWAADPQTVFTCCGESMRLVYKRVRYEDVP